MTFHNVASCCSVMSKAKKGKKIDKTHKNKFYVEIKC